MSSYLLDMAVAAQKHGLDTGQLLQALSTLIADHPEVGNTKLIKHLKSEIIGSWWVVHVSLEKKRIEKSSRN